MTPIIFVIRVGHYSCEVLEVPFPKGAEFWKGQLWLVPQCGPRGETPYNGVMSMLVGRPMYGTFWIVRLKGCSTTFSPETVIRPLDEDLEGIRKLFPLRY